MNGKVQPHRGSYEAALTEEQRAAFHVMLLSGITLAEARTQALPWPDWTGEGQEAVSRLPWKNPAASAAGGEGGPP
jgi:hypothetical protein